MAGIADKIRLYNEAYLAAWDQLNAGSVRDKSDSAHLDKIVRALINAGRSNASDIASEAFNLFRSQQKQNNT